MKWGISSALAFIGVVGAVAIVMGQGGISQVSQAPGVVTVGHMAGWAGEGVITDIGAVPAIPPATLATGTSVLLTAPSQYYICTGACNVVPPVPAAGYEFCVMNDDSVSTVITLAAIGSGAMYEKTNRNGYGTAGIGTLVSTGAVGDEVCLIGRDATHYLTPRFNGSWTAS